MVRSKHPLSKIQIWQALPFLSYVGKITSGWGGSAGQVSPDAAAQNDEGADDF